MAIYKCQICGCGYHAEPEATDCAKGHVDDIRRQMDDDLRSMPETTTKSSDSGTDIKPRIDDDGVPWCVDDCPQHKGWIGCKLDDEPRVIHSACPHAVRRMAVENEQLRARLEIARLAMNKQGFDWCEKMEQLQAKLEAAEELTTDIKQVVGFVLGWWPGYEDAIHWDDDMEPTDYEWYKAATRLRAAIGETKDGE